MLSPRENFWTTEVLPPQTTICGQPRRPFPHKNFWRAAVLPPTRHFLENCGGCPQHRAKLWVRYRGASHGGAIFGGGILRETTSMSAESKSGKDTLKVEKVSILVLGLCIAALVYLLVMRPF